MGLLSIFFCPLLFFSFFLFLFFSFLFFSFFFFFRMQHYLQVKNTKGTKLQSTVDPINYRVITQTKIPTTKPLVGDEIHRREIKIGRGEIEWVDQLCLQYD
jgi:hypothetical protein